MFAKWDKYWTSGNTLLVIACVLDSRCKLVVVEYLILDESIETLVYGQDWLRTSFIVIIFSVIVTYIFGILLWSPIIKLSYYLLLYCLWKKMVGILEIHYGSVMKRYQMMVSVMVRLELILM
jgi:Domain of unknown function (DUF4413)